MARIVPSKIAFRARLLRPATDERVSWTFLNLPPDATERLPSRSMVSVEGTLNGFPFAATLEPDGQGGHWLRVDQKLREGAGAQVGDLLTLEIAPAVVEPEPEVPADIQTALAADPKAHAVWLDITAIARRDWIAWITSGKREETRMKRIDVTLSKLAAGKRRPCCFDASGRFGKGMNCPLAAED